MTDVEQIVQAIGALRITIVSLMIIGISVYAIINLAKK